MISSQPIICIARPDCLRSGVPIFVRPLSDVLHRNQKYTTESWDVVHEGSPIVLLRKNKGTTEYQDFILYDLELTKILFEKHGDEFKIADYQNSKIKPAVTINRKNLLGVIRVHLGYSEVEVDRKKVNYQLEQI